MSKYKRVPKKKKIILSILALGIFGLILLLQSMMITNQGYSVPRTQVKTITYNQGKKDINYLFRKLKNSYACYKYENVDYKQLKQEMLDDLKEKTAASPITNLEFASFITDHLRILNNGHFWIQLKTDESNFYSDVVQVQRIFFTDCYFEKHDEKFYLFQKDDTCTAEVGSCYRGDESLLFPYPSKGKNIYRLGILCVAKNAPEFVSVMFESSDVEYQVPCKYYPSYYDNKFHFDVQETDRSLYFWITSYLRNISSYDKYLKDLGRASKDKDYIIVNLKMNHGGMMPYGMGFFSYLLSENNFRAKLNQIRSFGPGGQTWGGGIVFKSPVKIIKRITDTGFKGKIIILIDKDTASTPEFVIKDLREIKNLDLTVVGENSMGLVKSNAGLIQYILPESMVCIGIPHATDMNMKYSYDYQDGLGIVPDVWSTDEDIEATIRNLVDDVKILDKITW